MSEGTDLGNLRVSGDDAINDVMKLKAKLAFVQRENKALLKDRADLLREYNDLSRITRQAPIQFKPPVRKKKKDDFVRVIANDVHGQMMDRPAVDAFLSDLKDWDADEIVLNGDIIECGGFLAQHHTLGYVAQTEYSFQQDIEAANWFLDEVQKAAPRAKIHFIEGNHDCLTPDHEVLTADGWVPIPDVTKEHTVAAMRGDGVVSWERPERLHNVKYSGPVVRVDSAAVSAVMTPNHRVPHFGQYAHDLRYRTAESMTDSSGSVSYMVVSATTEAPDFEGVSDDEIRLVAWLLTDGHINAHVGISQSKPDRITHITGLLDRLEIRYGVRRRQRAPRDICGVAVKSVLESVTFDFTAESSRRTATLMGIADWSYKGRYEKLIPSWLHQLSDRQFKIFIDEVVLGDGSKASGGGAAFCVYGKENFLSSLQALCTVHGYRAHLKMRTRNGVPSFPVLNMLRKATSKIEGQRVTTEDYDGQVYCLTLPSSNFFVRHNGRVHLTGNCRIEKWIVDQTLRHSRDAEFLRQFLSPHVLLKLDERGILFHRLGVEHLPGLPKGWIKLGKCFFTHELSGSKNAAFNSLQKTAGNVVFAHCFSEDTEVLTPEGWVQLLDLQAGDTVGTLRLSDAGFEWQDNSEVVIYDHYDELVAIKNKNVDILVTPDHAMLTMSRKSVSLREGQSRTTLRKEKARDLLERSAFTMPLSAVNTNARFEDLTDDELRFFAWMLTEGCISVANKKYRSVRLAQSDCPTGGMVELDALLARMGIKHTKLLKYAADSTEHGQHRNYNHYNYNISSSNEVIEKFIRYCPGKLMGAWVLQLSADQFDVFIDTLITAGGSYNKSATRSAQYATNSNVNADIFQAACSINGRRTVAKLRYDARRPHAKPVWCITVNELGLAHIHLDSSFVGKVKYEGRVACCTVPNGTLLLRRNGKVFAAGNTHREDSATIVFPGVGLVKAWNPGCLCQRQPLWRHSDPTSWSQGYATQLVAKSEEFLHLNIPIWDGKSLMGNLINRMKG